MKWSDIAVNALERLPKNTMSRAVGALSEVELPGPMQAAVNRSFAALAGIDTDEAERRPDDYASVNDYFTRHLQQDARPVEVSDSSKMCSPVDGALGAFGAIEGDTLFQAKGRQYRLLDLVDSAAEAERFSGGHYATIYLSPSDYHRIHSPVRGRVERLSYIPGHLFPVNPFAVEHIDNLFAVNERLISYLETDELGRVAVIKVGATCVGRIGLEFEQFETNGNFRRRREFAPNRDVDLEHGDEMAVFNLGSTVIVLVESPTFGFDGDLETDAVLKMGESIGGG